jgi:hypothetical protein
MSDATVRLESERDLGAARILKARWRAGELSRQRLELASFVGCDAATAALGKDRPLRFLVTPAVGPATVTLQETAEAAASGRTFAELARVWPDREDYAPLLRTLGGDEAIGCALVALVRDRLRAFDPSLRGSALEAAGVAEAWLLRPSGPKPFDTPRSPRRHVQASKPMTAMLAFVRFFALARRGDDAPWGVDENAGVAAEVVQNLLAGPLVDLADVIRAPLLRWALEWPRR